MSIVSEKQIIGGIPLTIIKKTNLKNLYIRVNPPHAEVVVSSPTSVSDEEIHLFVLRKLPEIRKVQDKMLKQTRQTKRKFVSGEAHYLWGKPYMLKIVYGNKAKVERLPDKLVLTVIEGASTETKEKILNNWYRKELNRVLDSLIGKCEGIVGESANEYRIKNMKTKWGTCNIQDKRIWLNLQLVKKPVACLEYVLVHELVHLIEKNHTNRFYSLVEEFYPAWKQSLQLLSELPLDSID